ncbi:acyltransferase family protein [Sediminitomix flava]|uniref:Peptidoglycan/LPS O-acetylase OafA/YrhL n=1 Tax=Sediminitomix flava TaxID=379075 RepID=A0A316A4I6_SEDFL|nr:acyltransferase [Sediminitomix flava]PWJ44657.1 peptidoglycan/LPS O-acetylase OafA/YrhL [Sediminitomix flava]
MNKLTTQHNYISALTPLRGIAALWVVIFHIDVSIYYRDLGALVSRDATGILSKGYLWVDFFFLLSGFIICHVYGQKLIENWNFKTIKSFLWSRFSRLYPLHFFTLVILIIGVWITPKYFPNVIDGSWVTYFSPQALPIQFSMINAMNLYHFLSWNMPSWSIGAEWWTYTIAVFIIPLLYRKNTRIILLSSILAIIALGSLVYLHPNQNLDITWDYGFLRCLFEFIIGINIYQFYQKELGKAILKLDFIIPLLFVLIILTFHYQLPDLINIPIFILLILAAAYNQRKVRAILERPVFRFLGDISYSMYLVHGIWFFVFWFIFPHWKQAENINTLSIPQRLIYTLLFLSLTILSSAFTYYFIEIKARKKLRRMY